MQLNYSPGQAQIIKPPVHRGEQTFVLFLPSALSPAAPLQGRWSDKSVSKRVWLYSPPEGLGLQNVLDNTARVSGCICRASKAGEDRCWLHPTCCCYASRSGRKYLQ